MRSNPEHLFSKDYECNAQMFNETPFLMSLNYRSTIFLIIFRNFAKFQHRLDSPQVEQDLISCMKILVHELPHELLNDLRLRIFGNQKILGKYQVWVRPQPSDQSPFQKYIFATSSQKLGKKRYQGFLILSNFALYFCFLKCNLLKIVDTVNALDADPRYSTSYLTKRD